MKTKRRLNHAFLFLALFINTAMFCLAQNMGRIAILSFNGGSQDERDGIAELFSFTPQIMSNFTVIPRTTITSAINKEQNFQTSSGMTDTDTMVRLGNQFGANYVMAGSIASLGNSRLLIVSIVKIDVIQQVAGAFLEYKSLDDFNKDGTIIEKMATDFMSLMKKPTGSMNKLAVLPVQFSGGVNEQEGDALAQLLSIYLIQNGKYAVYPRTKTLEQVQKEYATQLSGITRDKEAVSLGRGINPQYVLSIASRKIGTVNRFNVSVIDLEGGNQIAGETEPYATLSDGINAMNFIAKKLSGIQVSERERKGQRQRESKRILSELLGTGNWSPITKNNFEVGYNYLPYFPWGFTIGTYGIYNSWNLYNADYLNCEEDTSSIYKYNEHSNAQKKYYGFQWILGYNINLIRNFFMIPIGIGGFHGEELRLYSENNFESEKWHGSNTWAHKIIAEIGLKIVPLNHVYIQSTLRMLGLADGYTFTIGGGLIWF